MHLALDPGRKYLRHYYNERREGDDYSPEQRLLKLRKRVKQANNNMPGVWCHLPAYMWTFEGFPEALSHDLNIVPGIRYPC